MRAARTVQALAAAWLAAGCATGSAEAQVPGAPARVADRGEVEARAHVYRVPPQEVAGDPVPYIQVSGMASVDVTPDRAHIRFAVETQAATAREASQLNASRMDAVIRRLRETNAPGLEIETSGYDLQPVYARQDRDGRAPTITGYRAVNHVLVTVDDVTAAGRMVDAAIDAGANRVASLGFEARDTQAARLEAIRLAVEKARDEARAMASALGVALGAPLEVQGGANAPGPRPPMPYYRMEAQAMDAVSTPVEPGDQTITASVTVKYRIGS